MARDAETDLKKPDGWLSVAGLYFLRDGVNTLGADPRRTCLCRPGPRRPTRDG